MSNVENETAHSESSDSEYDPQYPPIVDLPVVTVSTNEEDEEVLFKIRARLYRWVPNADPAEWKERGTGELKILRHKENNNVRIVMRRDKTLKVCANHFIVPWMELLQKAGNDKALVYTVAADFADEEAKSEMFAVKFATLENANLFKEKFNAAREIVKTKCSLYNGDLERENAEYSDDDESDDQDDPDDGTGDVNKKLAELDVSKNEAKNE